MKAKLLKVVISVWVEDDSQETLDQINIEFTGPGVIDWETVSIKPVDNP